jgi:hypothetical protein
VEIIVSGVDCVGFYVEFAGCCEYTGCDFSSEGEGLASSKCLVKLCLIS